jgi:hypothetical protein
VVQARGLLTGGLLTGGLLTGGPAWVSVKKPNPGNLLLGNLLLGNLPLENLGERSGLENKTNGKTKEENEIIFEGVFLTNGNGILYYKLC